MKPGLAGSCVSDAEPDRLFGGRLKLLQTAGGHRVGTDAVLLAAAASSLAKGLVVDLGAGVGAVGLRLAQRSPGVSVALVENDPQALDLAVRNVALNDLAGRARVVAVDILGDAKARRAAGLAEGSADLVATNPPFSASGTMRGSPDARRAAAHMMPADGLPRWLAAAADVLRTKGLLVMIHRADALDEVLGALAASGLGSVIVRPVHPKSEAAATRVLVKATKGGRTPLKLLPPFVLHEPDGRFTDEADAVHRATRRSPGENSQGGRRGSPAPPADAHRRGVPEQAVEEAPVADRADDGSAMRAAAMPDRTRDERRGVGQRLARGAGRKGGLGGLRDGEGQGGGREGGERRGCSAHKRILDFLNSPPMVVEDARRWETPDEGRGQA